MSFGMILVCDTCLKEIIIPYGYRGNEVRETCGWDIPKLFNEGGKPLPASSVICYCPNCKEE